MEDGGWRMEDGGWDIGTESNGGSPSAQQQSESNHAGETRPWDGRVVATEGGPKG